METKSQITSPSDVHFQLSTIKENPCPVAFKATKSSCSRFEQLNFAVKALRHSVADFMFEVTGVRLLKK